LTVGGVIVGLVLGVIVALITKKVYNDTILCINATVVTGFLGYFIAETYFKNQGYFVSGIMTLITIGLFMSNFVKKNFKGEC
jgi:NhaP-type Na+/H+ or K+/H+ antiporter